MIKAAYMIALVGALGFLGASFDDAMHNRPFKESLILGGICIIISKQWGDEIRENLN